MKGAKHKQNASVPLSVHLLRSMTFVRLCAKLWLDQDSNSGPSTMSYSADTLPLSYKATWSSHQQLFTFTLTRLHYGNAINTTFVPTTTSHNLIMTIAYYFSRNTSVKNGHFSTQSSLPVYTI